MKRTLVVGDIHGGLKALKQVLERAAVTKEDSLIFLGDYVDGWSESAQVIDYLMEHSKQQDCIFIKGNHDTWCSEWLKTGDTDASWLMQGGQATVNSYRSVKPVTKKKHALFFDHLNYYKADVNNRLFVHAGFTSMNGPEQELYVYNFMWDRTLWEMALSMDKRIQQDSLFFPKRLKHFEEIFIGHTPTINYNSAIPMQCCNVWNVDTGAAFTGKLTVMDINTKQFWQSDPVFTLYPNENGRNRF